MRAVTSRQNGRVKELRAALQRPGRPSGLIGLEGVHLLEEALRSRLEVVTVFVAVGREGLLENLALRDAVEILTVAPEVLVSAVTTETHQGIAALAAPPVFGLADVFGGADETALVLIAAGLQDPGNLGTLVRSAEAFGATGMVVLPGTVSVWNSKALRASAGSAFRLPVVAAGAGAVQEAMGERGVTLLAAAAHGAERSVVDTDLRGPIAMVVGNEGAGLPEEWVTAAHARVRIPCPGLTESLNAAVAGSLLVYAAARQRGARRV